MIEKIEIAVLDRLNQAFGNTKPALGYKIEKIDSYKAELSDFGTLIKNRRTAALAAYYEICLAVKKTFPKPETNENEEVNTNVDNN